jgi:hypothetical protein
MEGANLILFFRSAGAGGCGGRGGSVPSVGRQDLRGERGARVKWSRHHRQSMVAVRVAGLYLSERLAKRVKTDERNFADEVVGLKSHWRATPHRHSRRQSGLGAT